MHPDIRETTADDIAALEALYPAAFPEEDLLPLLRRLLEDTENVLSLAAFRHGELIGHIGFTHCEIPGVDNGIALMGPLAVARSAQKRGIGNLLVQGGFERIALVGCRQVQVLGDPGYYRRFGFEPDEEVLPPYDLPDAWRPAWQSVRLTEEGGKLRGRLTVPAAWQDKALWLP